mmetsp:Transcript_20040/g.40577  ORF Transcript_20040/g.40577 Transcript_20040/m.40577 type:complete len:121 (-) Transcript_20040:89-451(-)
MRCPSCRVVIPFIVLFLLAVAAPVAALAKPAKLSRVTIDVCPLNSMYVEVAHKIQKLEQENACLARQLEARSLTSAEKVIAATSSVSDGDEELDLEWERGSVPLRLRGGEKGRNQQFPVN